MPRPESIWKKSQLMNTFKESTHFWTFFHSLMPLQLTATSFDKAHHRSKNKNKFLSISKYSRPINWCFSYHKQIFLLIVLKRLLCISFIHPFWTVPRNGAYCLIFQAIFIFQSPSCFFCSKQWVSKNWMWNDENRRNELKKEEKIWINFDDNIHKWLKLMCSIFNFNCTM